MTSTSVLRLLRLHQRTAPLEARERATAAVQALPPARGRLAIASCHRIELYAIGETIPAEVAAAFPHDALVEDERVVARHLLRVACGLDSVIRGEGQILGQIRRALDGARASVGVDPVLSELVRRALGVGRAVRATTALGSVRRSVGSLAVDEAVRLVPAASRATALVVGAGELGKLAARALRYRVGAIVIANRDSARGEELAAAIGARAVGLARLEDALQDADVVISAADTRGALLDRELLARRVARGPLVIIDVAVPRSVDAEARALPGLVYRSVDDLAAMSPDAALDGAVAEAERRCEAAAGAFVAWRRERGAADAVRVLRERADRVREARLGQSLAKLRHLDDRDRRIVASLARALTNELLHAPTLALRRDPRRAPAALELFGIEE